MINLKNALIAWIAAVGGIWIVQALIPASFWFEVSEVRIFDAKSGESPTMEVDRAIHRPFSARWVAEVEKWDGHEFDLVPDCIGRGENNYSPDNKLPDDLDLNWWLYPVKCDLAPGQYRVETRWTLSKGLEVRSVSNVFNVTQ